MSGKRNCLSIKDKLEILDKIKLHKGNLSWSQLAKIWSIPKTTLMGLLKNEDDLRIKAEEMPTARKRFRNGKNKDVEVALGAWCEIASKQGMNITGPVLKQKAKDIAIELGHPEFRPTDGWSARFKSRHNIQFKRDSRGKNENGLNPDVAWHLLNLPVADYMNSNNENVKRVDKKKSHETSEEIEDKMDCKSDTAMSSNGEEHIQVDVDLQYYGIGDDDLSNMIALNIKQERQEEGEMEEKYVQPPTIATITDQEAKKNLEELRLYFMTAGNEDSPRPELDICYDYVLSKLSRN